MSLQYFRRDITCTTSENQTTFGFVERRDLPVGERAWKGFRVGAVLWGLAGFSIFVPIVHLILPPLLLLAGLIFGFAAWHTAAEISHGEFNCPNCQRTNKLGLMSESFPHEVRCSGCSFILKLEAKPT